MPETTLFNRWKRLSHKEKAVLFAGIKIQPRWAYIHQGMVPFLSHEAVAKWLLNEVLSAPRIWHTIKTKIVQGPPTGDVITLDDGLVFRRFGKHPERGVSIPGLSNSNRYRERRPFERKKDAYDVTHPIVALKHVGRNRWVLFAKEGVREHVLTWLQQNLGVKP